MHVKKKKKIDEEYGKKEYNRNKMGNKDRVNRRLSAILALWL